MLDRTRLAKILAMTTSTHDGEALSAIRRANEVLAGEKVSWEEVLAQEATRAVHVSVHRYPDNSKYYEPPEAWQAPHLKDKVTLDMMFRKIFEHTLPGTEAREFVDSVFRWYSLHKSVTPKQYSALRTFYSRASK